MSDVRCAVWLSALLGDGKSPRVKHIVCNNEGEPLLFDSQYNAIKFWRQYKDRFVVDVRFVRRFDRVTPQVVRESYPDDVLFDKLDSGEYQAIRPLPGYIVYSDDDNEAEWLETPQLV